MAVYLADSNFFIQAHRAIYPLDVATGFWALVRRLADAETIISIDKVKDELYDKNDDLEAWCKANLPANFFHDTSSVIAEYRTVSAWTASKSAQYLPNAISEFLSADEADAYLIAFALADHRNRTIVTQERSQPDIKRKVKIPEPCDELGISYINTIEMFRQLGVTF
ncbi:MAG: DUF4411 domain-containing protein [Bacteroidetes bacterium]|nr:MAG: DUF4411 domain-containing protein [Bacteroidota bacterium]